MRGREARWAGPIAVCKATEVLLDQAARLGAVCVDGEGRLFVKRAAFACLVAFVGWVWGRYEPIHSRRERRER